jgi:Ca2+-dependent lipid-binding protein
MKFTAVSQAKTKTELIVPIVFLVFLLSGCLNRVSQKSYARQCRDAEKVVKQAEKEYDDANRQLAKGKKDEKTLKNLKEKMQKLEDAQDKAFEVCSVKSNTPAKRPTK